jgi:hypothetical protein
MSDERALMFLQDFERRGDYWRATVKARQLIHDFDGVPV